MAAAVVCIPAHAATMSWLDNGQIRLGVNLDMGGAVAFLGRSGGGPNMVNTWDFGREIQLSFYSGPVPFQPAGSVLDPAWRGLGWNPIQAGDAFGHGSRVTNIQNDGRTIRLRCVPLIWPLKNVPAECVFDCVYRLSGQTVEVENTLVNARADRTQYPARMQELPAVYSNGRWFKLVSYTGDHPFTGAPVTTLVDRDDGKGWPWLTFFGSEHWAALVDEHNDGLGVFEPDVVRFGGGFAGKPKGEGGPTNSQTGYLAPNLSEILDCNITYSFKYILIVGNLEEIRRYAAEHSRRETAPAWSFTGGRCHWTCENTSDLGWPVKGNLAVRTGPAGAALLSPETCWSAAEAPAFELDAAVERGRQVSLSIETTGEKWIGPFTIPITADDRYRAYKITLAGLPGYEGTMRRLKVLLPPEEGLARIRAARFLPSTSP